jgi:hypothetical protein
MNTKEENLKKIELFPTLLINLVAGLNDADLNQKVVNWTIREVIHHLVDSHINSYIRIKLCLTENNPTIKPYDESAWSRLPDYKFPIKNSLLILEGIHSKCTQILRQMNPEDWNKTFFHPEHNKSFTLEEYLGSFASHGEYHMSLIKKIANSNSYLF